MFSFCYNIAHEAKLIVRIFKKKVTLEQISEIRRELKIAKSSLATYDDYLGQKETTSTDYSECGLIGYSIIDAQYHQERDSLAKLQYILTNAEYVSEEILTKLILVLNF